MLHSAPIVSALNGWGGIAQGSKNAVEQILHPPGGMWVIYRSALQRFYYPEPLSCAHVHLRCKQTVYSFCAHAVRMIFATLADFLFVLVVQNKGLNFKHDSSNS